MLKKILHDLDGIRTACTYIKIYFKDKKKDDIAEIMLGICERLEVLATQLNTEIHRLEWEKEVHNIEKKKIRRKQT